MSTLLASRTETANGTAAVSTKAPAELDVATFLLSVTAAATESGDKLNVYVQSSADGGTTYDDFIHFTEVLGNGGAVKHIAIVNFRVTPTSALHVPQDAALSAGVNQGPVANDWRVKWVVTDASTDNASFTFSISMASADD
jgi:hypothetical protein|tara:strand:- start:267 stop:689 length:423 start_codon:yes stop_codon:yes gene_type:complete